MNNLKKMLCLRVIAVLVAIASCKEDDPQGSNCENGQFKMTGDRVTMTGVAFNNTLIIAQSYVTFGKRMDIRATDLKGLQVFITITDLSSGTSGDGITTEDNYVSINDRSSASDNTFFFRTIEGGAADLYINGELDITACDPAKKSVSGTFSFTNGDEVKNGTFTDMCYSVTR